MGGGSASVTGLFGDIATTLLTPTQTAYVAVWALLVLKFLIFYDK